MAEEKNKTAEQETAEGATRQAPEADKPTDDAETTESKVETPEKEVKTPTEEEGRVSEADPAEDMSDIQRKAFQKQRQEIKALQQKVSEKKRVDDAFKAFKPPIPQGQMGVPQMPKAEDFMNQEGQIDMVGYQDAVQKHQQTQTFRIQENQRQAKFEMDQNLMKIKNPDLDPASDKYDPELEARIADRYGRQLLESMVSGQPEPSLEQIVSEVRKGSSVTQKEREKISKETLGKVSDKEQVASTAVTPSSGRAREVKMVSGFDELRDKTRHGDVDALAARIKAAGGGK